MEGALGEPDPRTFREVLVQWGKGTPTETLPPKLLAAATLWLRMVEVSLPYFLGANNWTRGQKKLTTVEERASLATETADYVLEQARARGMIA